MQSLCDEQSQGMHNSRTKPCSHAVYTLYCDAVATGICPGCLTAGSSSLPHARFNWGSSAILYAEEHPQPKTAAFASDHKLAIFNVVLQL